MPANHSGHPRLAYRKAHAIFGKLFRLRKIFHVITWKILPNQKILHDKDPLRDMRPASP